MQAPRPLRRTDGETIINGHPPLLPEPGVSYPPPPFPSAASLSHTNKKIPYHVFRNGQAIPISKLQKLKDAFTQGTELPPVSEPQMPSPGFPAPIQIPNPPFLPKVPFDTHVGTMIIRDYAYSDRNPMRLPGYRLPGLTALPSAPKWMPFNPSTQAPPILTRSDAMVFPSPLIGRDDQEQPEVPRSYITQETSPEHTDGAIPLGSPISLTPLGSSVCDELERYYDNISEATPPPSPLGRYSLLYTQKFIHSLLMAHKPSRKRNKFPIPRISLYRAKRIRRLRLLHYRRALYFTEN